MNVLGMVFAAALPVVNLATNSVAKRIEGVSPASALARFDDYPPSKGRLGFPRCLFQDPFPANRKFWLKDVDFSCASPWNDNCGALRGGTLISRRHVIFAKHFPLWKGVRIVFVDAGGNVCARHVKATKALDGCDIMIGLLDREVSPNIHPAKILPDDYAKHIGDGKGLPVVTFNQHEQALLSMLSRISSNGVAVAAASIPAWRPMGSCVVTGDSGNPAFLLIGNEPILLYCLHTGGFGHGPSVFHHRHEIQAAMDALCPGYKLQSFGLDWKTGDRAADF